MPKRTKRTKLRPEQKATERGLTRHWRGLFLETLAETSNVSEAARVSGASPSRAYKLRRENTEFRKNWGAALLEGYEHLEMETLERLRFGTSPDDRKFDIPNALRLLTVHRESAAKEKARRGKRDKDAVLASLNAKLDRMRERKAATQLLLTHEGKVHDDRD
ncbi:hypothetical protein [Aurantiacibacter marinus]|uniref:Terminase n=1 Tax=Aurantiacibacter marinus TaxID=874156 RepID=A0A0H0XSB4_9SPHN|nr:hypothetical protein [Aurantiacibacter marinus]KLI64866.1 hypothetical protein AAV99_05000 [Aurantiacibacter marinus]